MANVLDETKRAQAEALGRLGWSLRRIEAETGVGAKRRVDICAQGDRRAAADGGAEHAMYASVMSFARKLGPSPSGEACAVILTAPGKKAQVDYAGDGPLVRDAATGEYRRTRLFCMTLGWSRKSVRLVA